MPSLFKPVSMTLNKRNDEKSIKKMMKEGNILVDIELDESGITPDQVISYGY